MFRAGRYGRVIRDPCPCILCDGEPHDLEAYCMEPLWTTPAVPASVRPPSLPPNLNAAISTLPHASSGSVPWSTSTRAPPSSSAERIEEPPNSLGSSYPLQPTNSLAADGSALAITTPPTAIQEMTDSGTHWMVWTLTGVGTLFSSLTLLAMAAVWKAT